MLRLWNWIRISRYVRRPFTELTHVDNKRSSEARAQVRFLGAEEIKGVLNGRDTGEKERIMRWVCESLGLAVTPSGTGGHAPSTLPPSSLAHLAQQTHAASPSGRSKDIKAFVDEKNPKSDVQFAAVV